MPLLLAKLPYELISKSDTSTTRPALLLAGYLCESCKDDDGLRVVRGIGRGEKEVMVLCSGCQTRNGFEVVSVRRKLQRIRG
jgi:hypothetical protein